MTTVKVVDYDLGHRKAVKNVLTRLKEDHETHK